jgi:hypothetical protein
MSEIVMNKKHNDHFHIWDKEGGTVGLIHYIEGHVNNQSFSSEFTGGCL